MMETPREKSEFIPIFKNENRSTEKLPPGVKLNQHGDVLFTEELLTYYKDFLLADSEMTLDMITSTDIYYLQTLKEFMQRNLADLSLGTELQYSTRKDVHDVRESARMSEEEWPEFRQMLIPYALDPDKSLDTSQLSWVVLESIKYACQRLWDEIEDRYTKIVHTSPEVGYGKA